MTERRAIVIIDGDLQELPTGDTLAGTDSSGGVVSAPDNVDQSDATYFYFGWENVNGGWLVQRQLRSDGSTQSSTTGYVDLASAWLNRTTLTYS